MHELMPSVVGYDVCLGLLYDVPAEVILRVHPCMLSLMTCTGLAKLSVTADEGAFHFVVLTGSICGFLWSEIATDYKIRQILFFNIL